MWGPRPSAWWPRPSLKFTLATAGGSLSPLHEFCTLGPSPTQANIALWGLRASIYLFTPAYPGSLPVFRALDCLWGLAL